MSEITKFDVQQHVEEQKGYVDWNYYQALRDAETESTENLEAAEQIVRKQCSWCDAPGEHELHDESANWIDYACGSHRDEYGESYDEPDNFNNDEYWGQTWF